MTDKQTIAIHHDGELAVTGESFAAAIGTLMQRIELMGLRDPDDVLLEFDHDGRSAHTRLRFRAYRR
jgi:hypothetical protein